MVFRNFTIFMGVDFAFLLYYRVLKWQNYYIYGCYIRVQYIYGSINQKHYIYGCTFHCDGRRDILFRRLLPAPSSCSDRANPIPFGNKSNPYAWFYALCVIGSPHFWLVWRPFCIPPPLSYFHALLTGTMRDKRGFLRGSCTNCRGCEDYEPLKYYIYGVPFWISWFLRVVFCKNTIFMGFLFWICVFLGVVCCKNTIFMGFLLENFHFLRPSF